MIATESSTTIVLECSIGGPYSKILMPALRIDSQYVREAAVTTFESPCFGTITCTSTPRSSAIRSADSIGSSGIRTPWKS